MKKILCYGDSNTWGQAVFDGRIDDEKQWPNILQALLSADYKVIQEGLGGRIAGDFNENRSYRNGKTSYEVILRSAGPEIVIIALGTNDVKAHYHRTAQQIVDDLLWYADFTKQLADKFERSVPPLVYLLPPNFVANEYYDGDEQLRQEVIKLMKQTSQPYIELPELTMTEDGVHYSLETHQKVAEIIYNWLQNVEMKGVDHEVNG